MMLLVTLPTLLVVSFLDTQNPRSLEGTGAKDEDRVVKNNSLQIIETLTYSCSRKKTFKLTPTAFSRSNTFSEKTHDNARSGRSQHHFKFHFSSDEQARAGL